jgi:hypothetical protein
MSDHHADGDTEGHADGSHEAGHGSHGHDHGNADEGRITSPMQGFGSSQVTTGLVVLGIGLVVVFGIPLLL